MKKETLNFLRVALFGCPIIASGQLCAGAAEIHRSVTLVSETEEVDALWFFSSEEVRRRTVLFIQPARGPGVLLRQTFQLLPTFRERNEIVVGGLDWRMSVGIEFREIQSVSFQAAMDEMVEGREGWLEVAVSEEQIWNGSFLLEREQDESVIDAVREVTDLDAVRSSLPENAKGSLMLLTSIAGPRVDGEVTPADFIVAWPLLGLLDEVVSEGGAPALARERGAWQVVERKRADETVLSSDSRRLLEAAGLLEVYLGE